MLPDNAPAPASAQVKAGQDASGGAVTVKGNFANAANTAATAAIAGLTASTAYDVYVVAQDAVPNLQASPVKLDVTTAPPTPTLTLSSAALTAFSTNTGTPSAAQSYTLTGANLTASVVVTPPAGYEVSPTSATTGFAGDNTAITISQVDATAGKTIYVRLTGTTAGTYGTSAAPLNITHASAGATTVNKPVYGTVTTPTPVITVAPTTALAFSTTAGTPSDEQSYAVSATNLSANLTVTAPAAYEISLTSGSYTGTGGNALTLAPSSGAVASTTIFVRLTGAAAGTFGTSSTPLNITHASAGATTVNKPVYGTVAASSLATYSLTSVTGRAASAPATSKDANIGTAADLTRGGGLGIVNVSGNANLYGASGWSTSALADAQANEKYVSFALTPTVGFLINVSSIVGNVYRTTTGPTTVELLYSFTSDFANPASLSAQAVTTTASTGAAVTFSTNGTALQNMSTPVYFRLYGYGATSTTGLLYFTNNGTTPGLVLNGTTAASTQPVIATGTVSPAAVCGGSTLTATYTAGGPASTGTYFVQFSDASGSFASPLDLATTSSTSGSVTATVPATVASGTGYRVRVANTDGTRGWVSAAFTVVSNPTASVAPAGPQTINASTNGTALTVTETPAATSRQWLVATTSGGPYTAISGATGLTYTPTFAAAGTYYVVAQSTFAACGPVTSNEVVVTATTPTLVANPTSLSGLITSAGSVSAAQSYVLTGTGVTAPVTVTAPAGTEVSLDGNTFAASVAAPAASVNAGQTIYVRLLGSATGSVSGNVTNMVGNVTVNVAVSGSVVAPAGTLLAEDDFDYTGQLSANGWTGSGSSQTTSGNIVAATYPQGTLATGGTSYQARIVGTSGSALARIATVPTGTTALYAAALLNVTSTQSLTGSDYVMSFQTVSGGTSYPGRVIIARSGSAGSTKYVVRLRAASSTTLYDSSPTTFDLNTPYIFVLKVENSSATGNDDQFSVYMLPITANLSQEPSTPLLTATGANNVFSTIGAFNLRLSDTNNPTFNLDNFRFATGWGAAVGNAVYVAPSSAISAGSYYALTSSNNGQVVQSGPVTVEGPLALSGGRVNLNGQQLTLAGTVTGSGSLTGSATSNLVVLGTGALGTLNFTTDAQTLNNLTINRTSTGTATLGTPLAVGGTLALTSGTLVTTSTNLLTLGSAATIAGGSATSFVSGPLARPVGPVTNASGVFTSYAFPIGKGTAYRPLTLNVNQQSGNTTYRAEQVEGDPGQTGTDPAATNGTTLTRVSRVRAFTLTPYSGSTVTQPSSFQGTVTLSFGADDAVTDPKASSFVMGKRADASSPWANVGGSGSGSATAGTLTSGTITSFSDFALASTDPAANVNPLPVQLISFTAARTASGVQVAWATASEKNSAYFEVQRSLDGRTFSSVAKVAAQGTTTQRHAYSSLDGAAPAGQLYYRLRQVDLDGTVAYSPVVAVAAADGAAAEFILAPNPARERVSFITAVPTAYTVHNTLGQLVRSGTTTVGTNDLLVGELPAGVYFFELHGDAGRVVRRFVKE